MGSKGFYLVLLAVLTVLLGSAAAVAIATSTQYGGSVQAPSGVVLRSVCGDAERGLLFAVGSYGVNGTIFRITSLSQAGFNWVVNQTPGSISPQYNYLRFYACEVVDNYLFVVGETEKGGGQRGGIFLVHDITNPDNPQLKAYTETGTGAATQIAYRDVEVKKMNSRYYIYALSVLANGTTRLDNTSYVAEETTMPTANSIPICEAGCNGYGISLHGDYLGVLYNDTSSNLNLTIFDVLTGTPSNPHNVTVVQGFTGIRAAEATYSEGFLVAVAGELYRVYLSGGNWIAEEFAEFMDPSVVECNPYAMLVAESSGAKAAYIFTQTRLPDNTIKMCFIAVDLVSRGVITDPLTILEQPMEGYGDAYIVWVDSSMNIVLRGSSRPYMVYTITNGTSSYLIYYDLTQGGRLPYPIPEPPLLVVVGVVVAAGIAVTVLTRGKY